MSTEFSPADAIAMARGNGDCFGNNGWWIILIFMAFWGNGGMWGNNGRGDYATTADVQRATDFAALERQNNEGTAATRQAAYDVMTSVKDASYNNLSETREVQTTVNNGFANMQTGLCGLNQSIQDVKYAGALNTERVIADNAAQTNMISAQLREMEMNNEKRFHAIEMNAKDTVIAQLQGENMDNKIRFYTEAATRGLAREPIYATTFSPFAPPPPPPAYGAGCRQCY